MQRIPYPTNRRRTITDRTWKEEKKQTRQRNIAAKITNPYTRRKKERKKEIKNKQGHFQRGNRQNWCGSKNVSFHKPRVYSGRNSSSLSSFFLFCIPFPVLRDSEKSEVHSDNFAFPFPFSLPFFLVGIRAHTLLGDCEFYFSLSSTPFLIRLGSRLYFTFLAPTPPRVCAPTARWLCNWFISRRYCKPRRWKISRRDSARLYEMTFFFPKLRCQIRLRPSPFPPLLVAYTFHLLVREARPTPITQAEIRSPSQKRNEPTGLRA